jgi:hypothetical protein
LVSFQQITNPFRNDFFCDFAIWWARDGADGCYIVFSGFSTSRAILAQERLLNTTAVIAIAAAHSRRQDQWPQN